MLDTMMVASNLGLYVCTDCKVGGIRSSQADTASNTVTPSQPQAMKSCIYMCSFFGAGQVVSTVASEQDGPGPTELLSKGLRVLHCAAVHH